MDYLIDAVTWAALYGILGYLLGRYVQEHPHA